jgi:hypothetical protein
VQKLFGAVKPTARPTSAADVVTKVGKNFGLSSQSAPTTETYEDLVTNALGLILNGLTPGDIQTIIAGASSATNSVSNNNPSVPLLKKFYNVVSGDAPFSVPETNLRAAMYIPPEFTWGKKQPIIMSPGTGVTGGINFESNIGKLLSTTSFADPVYLNIPQNLLSDAQIGAEYVSYAIQYLYASTSKNVAVVTWSQGSLDAQWAFKYWPSTHSKVTDHIAISPDYHGTIIAYLLCPGFAIGNSIACTPSVAQQDYGSAFIDKLRSNGGDSAYVPVTTVYSLTDEIVLPQTGTAASGFINDARGVGASNTFLQGACAAQPAGLVYTHEGVLYNPVAYALVVDALTHPGPGSFDRVKSSCADVVAPGLSLDDVLETEALIPLAVYNILSYTPRALSEPPIKSYATF